MFRVEKKPKTPNMIWNASDNHPLCKFINGVIETNDEALAVQLSTMGHTVTGEADEKNMDKMTLDALKAYAAECHIELGETSKKVDIIKIIQEEEARRERR